MEYLHLHYLPKLTNEELKTDDCVMSYDEHICHFYGAPAFASKHSIFRSENNVKKLKSLKVTQDWELGD